MGIMDSAKGLIPTDQVDGAVNAAADAVKEKAPDQVDGAIDQGADMAKGAIKDQL